MHKWPMLPTFPKEGIAERAYDHADDFLKWTDERALHFIRVLIEYIRRDIHDIYRTARKGTRKEK